MILLGTYVQDLSIANRQPLPMSRGFQSAANRWLDMHYESEYGAVTATSKLNKHLAAKLEETVKKECDGAGSKPMSALFWVWRKAKVAARQHETLQEHHTPAGTVYSRLAV